MSLRLRHVALLSVVPIGIGTGVALAHMNSLPAFIAIAPGYLVQAWLFERHRALGGLGYQATMIGVSTLFWTVFVVGAIAAFRSVRRLVRRLTTATIDIQ